MRIGLKDLAHVSPNVLSGFVAEYGPRVAWPTLRNACGTLRVFLRYLYREGLLAKDISPLVEFPQSYRLSGIPRSIGWEQVEPGALRGRSPGAVRQARLRDAAVACHLRAAGV